MRPPVDTGRGRGTIGRKQGDGQCEAENGQDGQRQGRREKGDEVVLGVSCQEAPGGGEESGQWGGGWARPGFPNASRASPIAGGVSGVRGQTRSSALPPRRTLCHLSRARVAHRNKADLRHEGGLSAFHGRSVVDGRAALARGSPSVSRNGSCVAKFLKPSIFVGEMP